MSGCWLKNGPTFPKSGDNQQLLLSHSLTVEGDQFRGHCVKNGKSSLAQCADHDKVTLAGKGNRCFPVPVLDASWRSQQPLVKMPGKHQPIRYSVKNPIQLPMLIWWPVKVPEISHIFRVEPRFDMSEVSILNLESGSERGHKPNNVVTVLGTIGCLRLHTQPVVMIAPHTDGFGI